MHVLLNIKQEVLLQETPQGWSFPTEIGVAESIDSWDMQLNGHVFTCHFLNPEKEFSGEFFSRAQFENMDLEQQTKSFLEWGFNGAWRSFSTGETNPPSEQYLSLPYRKNVAIIAMRDGKFLLVNPRNDPLFWWKFPQGGIDEGEAIIETAMREFAEELGTDKIKLVTVADKTHAYPWPDEVIEARDKKFLGQEQHFVLVEFTGTDEDFNLQEEELRAFRWVDRETIVRQTNNLAFRSMRKYYGVINQILDELGV